MFAENRHRKRRAQVDMSPLIDVVFLLLIFFSVTTTFMEQSGMDLELPESSTATATETATIVVEIGNDGTIQYEGEGVTAEQMEQRISGLSEEERRKVTVRADRQVELGVAIRVIDALRRGGVTEISLSMVPVEQ